MNWIVTTVNEYMEHSFQASMRQAINGTKMLAHAPSKGEVAAEMLLRETHAVAKLV